MDHKLTIIKSQVSKQLNDIREIVAALKKAVVGRDDLVKIIKRNSTSARVRSGWHEPGEKIEMKEYELLLNNPVVQVRIIGNLDQHGRPEDARLDYAAPMWTLFFTSKKDEEDLLTYAQQFDFVSK